MNIFVLDFDPIKAAEYHCDKHVVKMMTEYAQLLSNAHRILDGKQIIQTRPRKKVTWSHPNQTLDELLYKTSHVNHPCSIWARTTMVNYEWLYRLLVATVLEYTKRYDKEPKIVSSGLLDALQHYPVNLKGITLTPFPQTMPVQYITPNNPVAAYRKFYLFDKVRFAKWDRLNNKPFWWHKNDEAINT